MKVSNLCIAYVKGIEGFESKPYKDAVGVLTLGYGFTGNTIRGMTSITEPKASEMLIDLLNNNYAYPINQDLSNKGLTLRQNEFDALVSMAFNIGVGGLLSSTLYRNVVKGVRDKATITANFVAWNKGTVNEKLQPIAGLTRRRNEEAVMFLKGNSAAPIIKPVAAPAFKGSVFIRDLQKEVNLQMHTNLVCDGFVGNLTLKALPIVNVGARGNITRALQKLLMIKVDGGFGILTLNALKYFQSHRGLKPDGSCGLLTWTQLLIKY